jgi:DNA-binding NtrC family response regulator
MTSSSAVGPTEAAPLEFKGVRILIVEDSWDVGDGLKGLLEAWGADVVGPVATADHARRLVSEQVPDVALVDINLRNGQKSDDLIDHLQEQDIPFFVITGYSDASLPKHRAATILQKPIREELLLASLRLVTRNKGT